MPIKLNDEVLLFPNMQLIGQVIKITESIKEGKLYSVRVQLPQGQYINFEVSSCYLLPSKK